MMRFFNLVITISILFVMTFINCGWLLAREPLNGDIKKELKADNGKTNARSPVLNVSPREIDFGVIGPGEGTKGNFVLKNLGSGVLTWSVNGTEGWSFFDEKKITGVLNDNAENLKVHVSFLKASGFSAEGANLVQLSFDTENRIRIYRKQLSFGAHRETIKLASNGGTRSIFIRFELVPGNTEPQIEVDPVRIDFGAVRSGENITRRIMVTNKGRETLRWQAAVQNNASEGIPPAKGRYISFFNEDSKGKGIYAPPSHLKESMDVTGRWTENNGFPASFMPSNTIRFRFWGTGIAVFFLMENGGASITAHVNEKNAPDTECRAVQKEKSECLVAENLPYGSHVLTVVNKSGRVIVEGVRVYGKEVKRGNPGWIGIFPESGTTTKEIDYVNIVVNTRHLDRGYYGENIVLDSNGGKVAVEISFEVSEDNIPKIMDIYRFAAGSDYLFTANPQAEANILRTRGYKKDGIAYRLFSSGTPGTTPFHRWYNAKKNDHFYSHDLRGEGKPLHGYIYEGAIGNIATSRLTNTRELYRWHNPATGCHFYSTDPGGEAVIKKGYRFDGIAGYVR